MTQENPEIINLLSILTPREERVLRLWFGINMEKACSTEEIAAEFNVTSNRVNQIIAKAFLKLGTHLKKHL